MNSEFISTLEDLFEISCSQSIRLIILTVAVRHKETSQQILSSGKHSYLLLIRHLDSCLPIQDLEEMKLQMFTFCSVNLKFKGKYQTGRNYSLLFTD